jgi:mono/diheme cytochrome c family protein
MMRSAVAIALLAAVAGADIWSGVYTAPQAKRGEAIYADRCASCHAPDLSGIDQAPALTGGDFTAQWNDQPVNDLFERVRISMPADKPGSLERQQVADVLAFLLQKNDLPAGQTELPTTAEALKDIRFLARKP